MHPCTHAHTHAHTHSEHAHVHTPLIAGPDWCRGSCISRGPALWQADPSSLLRRQAVACTLTQPHLHRRAAIKSRKGKTHLDFLIYPSKVSARPLEELAGKVRCSVSVLLKTRSDWLWCCCGTVFPAEAAAGMWTQTADPGGPMNRQDAALSPFDQLWLSPACAGAGHLTQAPPPTKARSCLDLPFFSAM